MTFNMSTMAIVRDSNPVPDPDTLVGSAEADELAMRRPGSIIDWHSTDDGYVGDGYRIRLLEPSRWEVSLRGAHLEDHRSLKTALSVVEHHRRDALRYRDLVIWAGVVVLAVVAGIAISAVGHLFRPGVVVVGFAVVFFGVSGLVRIFALLSGDVSNPYQRRLPWEPRPWWSRLFRR